MQGHAPERCDLMRQDDGEIAMYLYRYRHRHGQTANAPKSGGLGLAQKPPLACSLSQRFLFFGSFFAAQFFSLDVFCCGRFFLLGTFLQH